MIFPLWVYAIGSPTALEKTVMDALIALEKEEKESSFGGSGRGAKSPSGMAGKTHE